MNKANSQNPRYKLLAKFIRYGMVGVGNTCVGFSAMYVAASFGMHYLAYTAVGCLVGVFFSFFMNLYFTFRVKGRIVTRLALFLVVNISNIGIVELIEYNLIEHLHLNHLYSLLCAMVWGTITGFLLNNFFVYRVRTA